jgi:hypothetical protein
MTDDEEKVTRLAEWVEARLPVQPTPATTKINKDLQDAILDSYAQKLQFAEILGETPFAADFDQKILISFDEWIAPQLRATLEDSDQVVRVESNYGADDFLVLTAVGDICEDEPKHVASHLMVSLPGAPALRTTLDWDHDAQIRQTRRWLERILADGKRNGFTPDLWSALACIYDGDFD